MNTSVAIDLHTHSIISQDGSLTEQDYADIITHKKLHVLAITDHNTISFAEILKKKYPDAIIIGEEISSGEGDIIGLYLTKRIPPHLGIKETAKQIHHQGGLVLVPHPFERYRSSISLETLKKHLSSVDIIESFNARSKLKRAVHNASLFATENNIPHVANSDAHCKRGIPSAYTILKQYPTQQTLIKLLQSGRTVNTYAPLLTYLCPAMNRLRHRL